MIEASPERLDKLFLGSFSKNFEWLMTELRTNDIVRNSFFIDTIST